MHVECIGSVDLVLLGSSRGIALVALIGRSVRIAL